MTKTYQRPTNLDIAEQKVVSYHHTLPAGVPLDAVMDPAYWSHVSSKLRPGYRIEVFAEDGSVWAMLLVLSAGKVEAKVHVLQQVDTSGVEAIVETLDYEVKWRGPAKLFGVIRLSDGEVIKDMMQTKEEANTYLANYVKREAA